MDDDSNTCKEKENVINICSAIWNREDRIDELCSILQGALANDVEKEFVNYVIDNIEPTGWKAVWKFRCGKISEIYFNKKLDFLVDVKNMSSQNLVATISILDIINTNLNKDEIDNILKQINKEDIFVPLIEVYPISHQDNSAVDIESTTEVVDQIRFFYKNLWQPWDILEEVCTFNEDLIAQRMDIYESITSGVIPARVSLKLFSLKSRAEKLVSRIQKVDDDMLRRKEADIEGDVEMAEMDASQQQGEQHVDQLSIVELMSLHKQVRSNHERYEALCDPIKRELAFHEELVERKELLSSCIPEERANVLLVTSTVQIDVFLECIAKLPNLLKELSLAQANEDYDGKAVRSFPCLQLALDCALAGDVVAVMPGVHLVKNVGVLSSGGTICGLGEGVILEGCETTGDVVFDLQMSTSDRFVLHSVDLLPLELQTAISLHQGNLILKNCSVKGGVTGVSIFGDSLCCVEKCCVAEMSDCALDCRGASTFELKEATFKNCCVAIKVQSNTKVNVLQDVNILNCEVGIELNLPQNDNSGHENNLKKIFLDTDEKLVLQNTTNKYSTVLLSE